MTRTGDKALPSPADPARSRRRILGRLLPALLATWLVGGTLPVAADLGASRAQDTFLALGAGAAAPRSPLAGATPDIVLLVIDDLPQMDARVWSRLPTIRRLFLEQGTRFTEYSGNDPLCCPGRATLLTGQRTVHHGVRHNDARAFDPRVTLATELQDQGYHTIYAGKYFNGTDRLVDKTPPGWDHALLYSGGYWNVPLWKDGVRLRSGEVDEDYTTDMIRRIAMGWLRRAPADAPLLLTLNPFAVHSGVDASGRSAGYEQPTPAPRHRGDARCAGITPWRPSSYLEADRSDKPAFVREAERIPYTLGWPMTRICESLLSVDEILAAVDEQLRRQGRDDVLFVLTADNGMGFGAHGWAKKRVPYATSMPLLMHWPAGLGSTPRAIRSTASNLDIAPTLCAVAGCAMGPFPDGDPVDGLSLLPLLDRTVTRLPRDVLIEEHHTRYSGPRWVGIRTTVGSSLGRWVWTRYETGEEELYDLRRDPAQLVNVAADPAHAMIKATLEARLQELMARRRR